MVRFLFVCFTVQLNCKENENYLILNYRIHTFYVFTCKYINIPTKIVVGQMVKYTWFFKFITNNARYKMTILIHPRHTYVNGNRA